MNGARALAFLEHTKRLSEVFTVEVEGVAKMVNRNHATCRSCGEPTFIGVDIMYVFGVCKECFQSLRKTVKVEK